MAQLMPLPLTVSCSRLVLPFWYWLTWVVPDKGPLNGCVGQLLFQQCTIGRIPAVVSTCFSPVAINHNVILTNRLDFSNVKIETECLISRMVKDCLVLSYYPDTHRRVLAAEVGKTTHTHPFNGPLSGTTRVSRYQKGKNQSGFYWSKRQWVAVASAGPYASLHLPPGR